MAITLAQAEAQLALWIAADAKVAQGQAFTIGERSLTRAKSDEIQRRIDYWQAQVNRLTRGGIVVRGVTPA